MVVVSPPRRRKSKPSFSSCLCRTMQCLFSFYLGVMLGSDFGETECTEAMQSCSIGACEDAMKTFRELHGMGFIRDNPECHTDQQQQQQSLFSQGKGKNSNNRFPDSMGRIAKGEARVSRKEFASTFQLGVPIDPSEGLNRDVLIIYNDNKAMPNDENVKKHVSGLGHHPPLLSAENATENCDYLNVILTHPKAGRKQCVAIMGQYESFHIQKFLRVKEKGGKIDKNTPLRLVSRGYQSNGKQPFRTPDLDPVKKNWKTFSKYVSNIDAVLQQLKPVAERVAKNNTIVVLTCNHGQSELLMNFACSNRANGLPHDNVLIFPTDKETMELANGLGLATFYDELNFGEMPTKAAKRYGDSIFSSMMFAKVYCVHMISMLGYDLLFQDVDIVWYRNPLDKFLNTSDPDYGYDMFFQDDGARSVRFAPYSANSGFYFVRNNVRTKYFFHSLLAHGEMIHMSASHQQALIATMAEHVSLYGLKVKTLDRNQQGFPGGFHYHKRKDFMKELIAGKTETYIFHMCWTLSKTEKLKFMQQMGLWYVRDQCIGRTAQDITSDSNNWATGLLGEDGSEVKTGAAAATAESLVLPCCAAKPIITCHFKDKPSVLPCPDSPYMDTWQEKPFWT